MTMDIKPAGMGMPLSAKPDAKAGLKEAAEGFEAIFPRTVDELD